MEDEQDLNLDFDQIEGQAEAKLKVKNRFEKLSEKVILTAKERDELAKAKETLEAEKSSIAKERDFFKDFSANVSKYPQASEFQDKILEKVKSGYQTEDAIVAVLNKEGRLVQSTAPTPQAPKGHSPQVEGGSAPTGFGGGKSLQEMSVEEKYAALQDADKSGDLVSALRA